MFPSANAEVGQTLATIRKGTDVAQKFERSPLVERLNFADTGEYSRNGGSACMKTVFTILLGLLVLGSPLAAVAQALTAGDINGDGSSDITLIQIQGDSTLAWSEFSKVGALIPESSITFGQAGNHIVLANWASKTRAQRATVSLSGSNLLWSIVSDQATVVTRTFGSAQGTFLAGGDFNGNGFADVALIEKPAEGSTLYKWRVRADFLKDVGQGGAMQKKVQKFDFGTVGDVAFYMNPDRKNDWLAVLGANTGGSGSVIRLKNPKDGKTRRFTVPGFTYASIRPLPIRQKAGGDLLALATHSGGNTVVTFVNANGRTVSQATLPGEGELIVGDFLATAGQELAIQTDSGILVRSPVNGEEAGIALPAGILIDDININSFDSDPSEPSCSDETLDPHDGTDRFLWKPAGVNSGTLRVLFPQIWTGKIVEVVLLHPTTGLVIAHADVSYDASNPNARTFAKFNKPGGQYPDGLTVRARLAAGCYKSYVIPETSVRTD